MAAATVWRLLGGGGYRGRGYAKNVRSFSFHSSPSFPSRASELSSGGSTLLAEKGPFACKLSSRAVIGFEGEDVIKFLQGLTTNNMNKLEQDSPTRLPHPTLNQPAVVQPPLYTAILNPQGRFLFDMVVFKPVQSTEKLDRSGTGPGSEKSAPKLVADVDAESVSDLHKLRAKISFSDMSKELAVWQRFGGALECEGDNEGSVGWGAGRDVAGNTSASSNVQGWRWHKDPRTGCLGFRAPLIDADQEVDEQYYLLWRLEQGIPEGPAEIRGEIGEAVSHGAEIVDAESSKKMGTVTTALGSRGFALVRLEAVSKPLSIGGGMASIQVKVLRPKWWLHQWD
ncbi:putative transferase At4g12130, mitochondrial [Selaginella moellendorffii]|uniref:putative transferase At4g12130, mitochondrial n=1 Tax=Selaginella moellendorffii TaxID=88036 RepID=UPI000D1C8335|nr:putative transferase At4g12130, mitochondrial [Selaginella moellendorffii]|eukprot:XP_024538585.1 putative transferase At4g12130, mitochondrial [Selaginella moellendorffii]